MAIKPEPFVLSLQPATFPQRRPPRTWLSAEQARRAEHVADTIDDLAPGTAVGLEVFDRETHTVRTHLNASRPFHAASVTKLLIALDTLTGPQQPSPDIDEQVHTMLATSNDDIANTLWGNNGQDAIITRTAVRIGLTATQPPSDPDEWGETLITADDVVRTYRYITDELPTPQKDLILHALAHATPQAADGFDQYFGIPTGIPDRSWAIKQGWMRTSNETDLNTTGLVGPNSRYIVTLLTSTTGDTPWPTATAAITAGTTELSP
jgi:hypothetical protein